MSTPNGGVAFDLPAMDRLAGELLSASGSLGEQSVSLSRNLTAAGVSTEPSRRVGEAANWCYERSLMIKRRADAVRAADALAVPTPTPKPAPVPASDDGGGGGVGGWLSDRKDDLGKAADDVRDGVTDFTGGVVDRGEKALDAVGGWTVDRWNDAAAALERATEKAGEVFEGVVAWASKTIGGAIEWADGALDDAGKWIDKNLSGVRSWIGEHANILRTAGNLMSGLGKALVGIGAALAALSAAAGFFSFGIGWLGELPAGAILAVGFVFWGGGEALNTAADWGEGKIDGRGLLTGVAIEVAASIAAGKIIKGAGKLLEPLLPRLRRWVDDLPFGGGGTGPAPPLPAPHVPARPPDVDPPNRPKEPDVELPPVQPLPGLSGGLRGGTADDPFRYEFRNPGAHLGDAPEPSQEAIDALGRHSNFPSGSEEHMLTGWRDYLRRQSRTEGATPQDWNTWRDGYVRNHGHAPRGRAFEEGFRGQHGFGRDDGWRWQDENGPPSVPVPGGGRRDFDILNVGEQIAYELKSGGTIDFGQMAKDRAFVKEGWEIVYVFGSPPTAAVRRQLEEAGIRVEVWHGAPVETP